MGSTVGTAVPNVLYHYTTLHGIIGIAQNKHLWASSIRYLADSTEFSYAHDLLSEVLRTNAGMHEPDVAAVVEVLLLDLSFATQQKSMNVAGSLGATFVVSFSRNGDQLSQWRAYCPGGGYALGFRSEALLAIASELDFDLVECSYDTDVHRRECAAIAQDLIDSVLKIPKDVRASISAQRPVISVEAARYLSPLGARMLDEIQRHAPRWKHESFHEEAEWRLVSRQRRRLTKFRVGRTAIIPYIEIQFDRDSTRAGDRFAVLDETVVGPCPERDLAVGSAMHLFEECKIASQNFRYSRAPFRSW